MSFGVIQVWRLALLSASLHAEGEPPSRRMLFELLVGPDVLIAVSRLLALLFHVICPVILNFHLAKVTILWFLKPVGRISFFCKILKILQVVSGPRSISFVPKIFAQFGQGTIVYHFEKLNDFGAETLCIFIKIQ